MRLLSTVALAALAAGCTASQTAEAPASAPIMAGAEQCGAVGAAMLGGTAGRGQWVAAANGLPAYCEVTGTLSPASGSNIGVVYRLPAGWNGKVLGFGGGGWIGNIALGTAAEGLRKGYATMQTDGGHPIGNVWDNAWAANAEAAKDFSYRALHEMTVAGKRLVADYYDQPHRRAYYQGCSTGGRMGLMEAQRYPDDYDVISAGAPVYTLQVQTSAVLRNLTFQRGSGGFAEDDLKLAQGAAVAACDAQDGQADGLINDPRQCRWDPAAIQCTGAKTASCLAPAQVTALRTAYDGVRGADGEWAMLPMSRGGEAGWSRFIGTGGSGSDPSNGGGLGGLWPTLFGQPANFSAFVPSDVARVRATPFAEMYEAKDANLGPFFASGGKLLLWHGESDPGPSPVGTNDYVKRLYAAAPAARSQMRYFLLPGTEHCGGGPGASRVAWLDLVESWDETGRAPGVVHGGGPGTMVRPHCAWPQVARYRGVGDADDPANWQCVARG